MYRDEVVAFVVEAFCRYAAVKLLYPFQKFWVVVESALVNTPVTLLYASGYAAESDEELILLVKVVQSAEERAPA